MSGYTTSRLFAKTFLWRIIATLTGAAVTFALTGEVETAGKFIVIEFPLKMLFYYLHEIGWNKTSWGKIAVQD
ncbi:MAG: DUF2061 domain-containing protein [Candidatus Thalassarchaeaceae archaeon]|nr:DUF2061 domain-containing protein [Candidatus Thalassarchaeaceae archaeon]